MISLSGLPMIKQKECDECGSVTYGQHCETCEPVCDHEGMVHRGRCESCGERGLESDAEIYSIEAAI